MPIISIHQKTKRFWFVGGKIGPSSSAAVLGGALDYTCILQECMEDRGQPWRSNLWVKWNRSIVFSRISLQLWEFLLNFVIQLELSWIQLKKQNLSLSIATIFMPFGLFAHKLHLLEDRCPLKNGTVQNCVVGWYVKRIGPLLIWILMKETARGL